MRITGHGITGCGQPAMTENTVAGTVAGIPVGSMRVTGRIVAGGIGTGIIGIIPGRDDNVGFISDSLSHVLQDLQVGAGNTADMCLISGHRSAMTGCAVNTGQGDMFTVSEAVATTVCRRLAVTGVTGDGTAVPDRSLAAGGAVAGSAAGHRRSGAAVGDAGREINRAVLVQAATAAGEGIRIGAIDLCTMAGGTVTLVGVNNATVLVDMSRVTVAGNGAGMTTLTRRRTGLEGD